MILVFGTCENNSVGATRYWNEPIAEQGESGLGVDLPDAVDVLAKIVGGEVPIEIVERRVVVAENGVLMLGVDAFEYRLETFSLFGIAVDQVAEEKNHVGFAGVDAIDSGRDFGRVAVKTADVSVGNEGYAEAVETFWERAEWHRESGDMIVVSFDEGTIYEA